ncbi:hypothetical protein J132_03092 [Termitomyces sp. J132]|nr:hypothetical protein J132_03092 [Termitomyces sp. J132]
MVASEEGKEDMEMREMTPLATVAEVEWEASDSDMEVKSKEEFKVVTVAIEENKGEGKGAEEAKGTWSNMPLYQIGNNELEWLDFDERAAGVERRFQRELEAAREELVVVRAQFTVTKWTLKENNVGKEDWEEKDLAEVPDDNADLGP